ncbi:MAG TPA: hypothetical protein PK597_05950 [Oscillospiraceae bacterium]|nr:hypothetical protein [Oscillospiraceae bacterium]
MPEGLKQKIASEQSMKVINALFFLALITRSPWFICLTFLLWSLFLVFSIRKTESRVMKAVYSVFLLFAVTVILLNLYAVFRGPIRGA